LYGLYNIKILFIASVVILEAGSALCGAAQTMDTLIVGRAICGIGSIGIYVGVMNILSTFTTISERPKTIGYMTLMWGLGTV
jgi:MFS family permease